MGNNQPTVLVILDGFGYAQGATHNAIKQAHTPTLDALFAQYPHTLLKASGAAVGLPDGFIGNSEVGHMTIGSGQIIPQELTVLHNAIDDGTFFENTVLRTQLNKLKQSGKALHLMGLLSDAGVHSHQKHLYAFITAAQQADIKTIYVHPFLDGRDVAPQSAVHYLTQLEDFLRHVQGGAIGTIQGRFFAMDRDNNWDRTQKSYAVFTQQESTPQMSWRAALEHYYQQGITDEFIPPTQCNKQSVIQNGDGIIFFNFRPDRARQLIACFVDPNFHQFNITPLQLAFFITPVPCSSALPTTTLFEKPIAHNTLFDILAAAGKRTFAIAETEKYAHVTYFFHGGTEAKVPHETVVLIPSIKTTSFATHPTMSAQKITDAVMVSLDNDPCDFYLINYANADMVGHSGNFVATVQAIECLDQQIQQLYELVVEKMNGTLYITADHGNAEQMWDHINNQPHTAHTTNPVPFLAVDRKKRYPLTSLKGLADITPFILENMGLTTKRKY